MHQQPGDVASHRTPRVVAARRLTTRAGRAESGHFLAEGAQAVGEALRYGRVHELFCTESAAGKQKSLLDKASELGVRISPVTARAAELLSETISPQGLIAICDQVDVPLERALAGGPRLVAVLAGISDPGNAGTVLRVADAAGADAVILTGDSVDVHNGKCVRASTGSLFHLPVSRAPEVAAVLSACSAAGLAVVAADGLAPVALDEAEDLDRPTAWLLGNEAHGLDPQTLALANRSLRVPLYGQAESLNLATAAAVCLYASAMAARRRVG